MDTRHAPTGSFHRLSIVIPAYNEEDSIETTIAGLREAVPEAEIIVVDDGSTDSTGAKLDELAGIKVVRHIFTRGYGAAIKTGARAAGRDFIAWFDADGEHRAEDLVAMAERLEEEHLAAVIGQRLNPGRPPVWVLGKLTIRLLAWSLGVRLGSDLNCGLRIFRRPILLSFLSLLPNGFSASMTSTMILIARHLPIAFQPIVVRSRVGSSKVRLGDGFSTLLLVLQIIMLFAPLRIFLLPGAALMAIGFAYSLATAIALGQGFPIGGFLMMNTGMLLGLLGLIADQVSRIRLDQMDRPETEILTAPAKTSRKNPPDGAM